ncbi:MAG: 1-acyl-sn-glycerol-3-phosphate acyltransferase [Akkermansiaceae bacterium]
MKEDRPFADLNEHVPALAQFPQVLSLVESLLGLKRVREVFAKSAANENPAVAVAEQIDLTIRLEGLEHEIPAEGPVVIAANHSHGGTDALALAAKCIELRKDTLILANAELMRLPGINRFLLPVNILGGENSAAKNMKSLRVMLKHVRAGGALVVFPAGRVAYWQKGEFKDPPWNEHVVTLISRMEATVVPIWFFGGIPAHLKILSALSGFLRTAFIPKGLAAMSGGEIVGRVGNSFHSDVLKSDGTDWLRKHLESLRDLGN